MNTDHCKNSLKKRVLAALLAFCMILGFCGFSASESFAASALKPGDTVHMTFLAADIVIDGTMTDNYFWKTPVLADSNGRVYIPASAEFLNACGLELKITKGSGAPSTALPASGYESWLSSVTAKFGGVSGGAIKAPSPSVLEIRKTGKKSRTFGHTLVRNLIFSNTATAEQYSAVVCTQFAPQGSSPLDIVNDAASSGRRLTGFGTESIILRDPSGFIYFPVEFFQNNRKALGVSAYYSKDEGLYISTNPDIDATRYINQSNLGFIKGTAQWINMLRPELTPEQARYYEYLFRHEANVNGIDEKLIMGVATTESYMRADSVSAGGAIGMMQTLGKYARNYGYTYDMLLTPHYSIELGARYLRDRWWAFKGDTNKVIASYQVGISAAKAGAYVSSYVNKTLGYIDHLNNYLTKSGYATKLQNWYPAK